VAERERLNARIGRRRVGTWGAPPLKPAGRTASAVRHESAIGAKVIAAAWRFALRRKAGVHG
jgi:hypothetical protein